MTEDRLVGLLEALGASTADARAAVDRGAAGPVALDLALRSAPPIPVADAAAQLGIEEAELMRVWHALGLATPTDGTLSGDVVAALPVVSRTVAPWLGGESTLGLVRVLGSAAAHIAEALVDAFRVDVEVPGISAGTSYADIVESSVALTQAALPPFESLMSAVVRAHLVRVSSGTWAPDADRHVTSRELFVGFVDLVGYTALSRTLRPGELAVLLRRFDEVVSASVAPHGRVVKLVGDGAMFVCDDAATGAATALSLCEQLAATGTLPPARVGADVGSVVNVAGDYYGDVVNCAARLVALARPETVVVTEHVAAALDENSFALERLPAQALKGFDTEAVTFRLSRR